MSDVETLSVVEGVPAEWPAVAGVTGDLLAVCWQRIEHFIARRFVSRPCVFVVRSACGGPWKPPLIPRSGGELAVSHWDDATSDWEPVTLRRQPLGWMIPPGTFQIEMSIGRSPAPAPVSEAVKRLAAYLDAETLMPAGARSYSATGGQLSESITGAADHMARALQNSGAADLLRPYRRA